MVQERREVPGPSRRGHLSVHAGADAGDLGLADLVDFVRRQVGGRVAARLKRIEFLAAREGADADGFRGRGQVFVLDEIDPGLTARCDLFGDDGGGSSAQLGLGLGRDRAGQGGEGLQQRIGLCGEGRLVAEGEQRALDDRTRLYEAALQPTPGVLKTGVVEGGDPAQPRQPGVGIGTVGDAGHAGQIGSGLAGSALGVEGQAAAVIDDGLDRPIHDPGQEGVVQGVIGRQVGCVDRRQPGLERGQRLDLSLLERPRRIGQARLGGLVALVTSGDRVQRAQIGFVVRQNRRQRQVLGLGDRGRWRLSQNRQGGCAQQKRGEAGCGQMVHASSPDQGAHGDRSGPRGQPARAARTAANPSSALDPSGAPPWAKSGLPPAP